MGMVWHLEIVDTHVLWMLFGMFVCHLHLFLSNHDATFIPDDLIWNRLICFWAMWCLSIGGGGGQEEGGLLMPSDVSFRQISPPLHSLYHTSTAPSSMHAFGCWSIFKLLLNALALSYSAPPLHPISPNIHTCTIAHTCFMFQSALCTYVYFP